MKEATGRNEMNFGKTAIRIVAKRPAPEFTPIMLRVKFQMNALP